MKKRPLKSKDYSSYRANAYDDMKDMLNKARRLTEQNELDIDIETDVDVRSRREKEKTKVYTVSSGKVVLHGQKESELTMTDDEKTSYQETMDDFIDQVSDLVDYQTLNIYYNNVEWGGRLIKQDLDFFFTVGESNGVFISGDMMRLDDDFVSTVEQLRTFYKIFSAKWAKVLANRKITDVNN